MRDTELDYIIKGFKAPFPIGSIVYFKVDEDAQAHTVDGYAIKGPAHDKLVFVSRMGVNFEAYPHELTAQKPIEGVL